jgi:tetratricopeptide (TPR) repeat protein
MPWNKDQEFESDWWGNCVNTFGEEYKQLTYANRMGLAGSPPGGKWPVYNMRGRSIVDIGGGPVSMLLKTDNVTRATVVDPCTYPVWVSDRYKAAGIDYLVMPGEDFEPETTYDECWIYNCLQHVLDPEKIIRNAKSYAGTIRIFEWIDIAPHLGHPQELKENSFNEWLGGSGKVEWIVEHGSEGANAYYGAFRTPAFPVIQEKRAELYPTPDNLVELSVGYFQAGRYHDSIAAARKALALSPEYAEAYNNICIAENVLGNFDEARKAGEAAVRLQPNHQIAINNLNWAIEHSKKK